MPTFEVGSWKHIKKTSTRVQRTYYVGVCTRTKGARVRPTIRAYGDAEPGFVCPTATPAAGMLREAHCCCRCRTSGEVVVTTGTRNKLFLLDKTGDEMQFFRPRIVIVLNFNHKTLLDKTCQVLLCVLDSFYWSTSSTTSARVYSSIPEIYKFCGHSSVGFSSSNLLCRISRWKPGYTRQIQYLVRVCAYCCVFHIPRVEEAKNIYKIEMHPRRRTVVRTVDVRSCSFSTIQNIPYSPSMMHRRYDYCRYY